jgi:endoglucanase
MTRSSLERDLLAFVEWGQRKGVPLYLAEFATGQPTFQDGKGGLEWVNDMVDLAMESDLHFTYHGYHSDEFGLYFVCDGLPDENSVNQALADLLRSKLR